ncbi:MAG: alpha-glucosidase C-terminal domain-containing protein, partial [Alphaproteobacteria bacterium]|nr:alpha-glucosidase C-terminal domain-containing protein [Alphaproteobacteria bacterium]MDX5416161.1 alpha-glucosidase C-terminal domain-containing protein [Alphaproteobacteria bacterium]MDX5493467.1 alpha-glucosidase C-terminal domain-containing protein [Alphaproteobacteria bacterium]
RLHTGFTFDFIEDWSFEPSVFRAYYEKRLAPLEDLFPCVTFSNHDVPRPVTRWGGGQGDDALAKLALTLLLTLKGNVLMFQGEELGLPEVDLDWDDIHDPVGDLYYPWMKGRDGCRTPMPWEAKPAGAGFTTGKPWLPIPDYHKVRAVDVQAADESSVLAHAREVVAFRKAHLALRLGEISFLDAEGKLLAFTREEEGEKLICVFNLGTEAASFVLPKGAGDMLLSVGDVTRSGHTLHLGAKAAGIFGIE